MRNTTEAIEAKNGAIKLIRDNIEKIYDDFIVNEKIYLLRFNYCVKDDLYTKNEKEAAEIKDIEKLINFLDEKRLEQIREDDKNATEGEKVARLNALIVNREKEWAEEMHIDWPTQEIFKIENDDYVNNAIKDIMRGTAPLFLFNRININPDLWRSVIAAMVLRVPPEKALECDESILTRYFLPIVDNDCLIIRFNELTKRGDLSIIWDLVEARQNDYTAKYGYVNSTSTLGYPSRKEDRIITKCYRQGLNPDQIHVELAKEDITRKYTNAEFRERIEEYLKQTRQPAEKIKFACT